MSLRLKVACALALLAAGAGAAITFGAFANTRTTLDRAINQSLERVYHDASEDYHYRGFAPDDGPDTGGPATGGRRDLDRVIQQFLDGRGNVVTAPRSGTIPVDAIDREVARETKAGVVRRRDVTIDGESFRLATVSRGDGLGAAQFARSLEEVDEVLESLARRSALTSIAVTLIAAALGWLIAVRVTRRLVQLTDAVEHVGNTGQLDTTITTTGSDEVGRLTESFNAMLAALASSREAQQQLAQDAGHELRTPLTSLRTNIDVLQRFNDLPIEERNAILDDLRLETDELTQLVNELVDLATDQRNAAPATDCALGELAERSAARARRRWPQTFVVDADDTVVHGDAARLERAVSNLIDNAAKFSPEHSTITVRVRRGEVSVGDEGRGIAASDLDRIFDRFYRSDDARSAPGSGLGLAIVRDVAIEHHGSVFARNRVPNGATVGFSVRANPDFSPSINPTHSEPAD